MPKVIEKAEAALQKVGEEIKDDAEMAALEIEDAFANVKNWVVAVGKTLHHDKREHKAGDSLPEGTKPEVIRKLVTDGTLVKAPSAELAPAAAALVPEQAKTEGEGASVTVQPPADGSSTGPQITTQ